MASNHLNQPIEKSSYVRDMFAGIAPRYDVANRVLTAGIDERWRRRAIVELRPPSHGEILDLCCGTGDLVFHMLRCDPTLQVTGLDFCEPMLAQARRRSRQQPGNRSPRFLEGDVMQLPFENAQFDGATMGFSLRNVVDIDTTLREARRVLRPGARFVNLDVSKAPNPLFKKAFDFYFYGVVPVIGGWIGGSKTAYRYLPQSLTHYPGAAELRERFALAGFANSNFVRLMGGAIAIHVGTAP